LIPATLVSENHALIGLRVSNSARFPKLASIPRCKCTTEQWMSRSQAAAKLVTAQDATIPIQVRGLMQVDTVHCQSQAPSKLATMSAGGVYLIRPPTSASYRPMYLVLWDPALYTTNLHPRPPLGRAALCRSRARARWRRTGSERGRYSPRILYSRNPAVSVAGE
jgi:hypothetical protein